MRPTGEIADFKSGVKEAGRGFMFGYADAISGVFTEPFKGAQKEVGYSLVWGGRKEGS